MTPRQFRLNLKHAVEIYEGMYGLPDGSVFVKRGRGARGSQLRFQGDPPLEIGVGEFFWDNPPGPVQGVTFGLRSGIQYIGPRGLVTPTQASKLLGKSRVWVYKLIRSGRLRPVRRGSKKKTLIPLRQIKKLLGFPEEPVRPICPGGLWGYDSNGEPWLVG
jgi:excisionase family DNA binding protein